MKKILKVLLVAILFYGTIPLEASHSSNSGVPETPDEVIKKINQDMYDLYNKREDYYKDFITKNGSRQNIRKDLIQKRLDLAKNPDNTKDNYKAYTFEMVYGSDHGAELIHKGKKMREYSGYSKDGHSVPSEGVPWFAGWSGTKIQDFDMFKSPWKNEKVKEKYNISKTSYDNYRDLENKLLLDGTFEQSIITGLNKVYGEGHTYEEFMYNNQNSRLADYPVYDNDSTPSIGGRWIDYVHVLQPPTELSWGFGTIYIDSNIGITYLDIPLAPFSLIDKDLSAKFDTFPKEAVSGERVKVAVKVNSNYPDPVTPEFEWSISSGGSEVSDVTFSGHASSKTGSIRVVKNESRVLVAEFTMPEEPVRVQFKVNPNGKSPEEANLGNNLLDKSIKVLKPVELGYNVLSKKEVFYLDHHTLTAKLRLPRPDAEWTGPATGKLNVTRAPQDLFREWNVTNNPVVNEWNDTISRTPIVNTTIKREDFGDDPLHRKWKNPSPDKVRREGSVSYEGSVKRDYKYDVEECSTNSEGKRECRTRTMYKTATADFEEPGEDRKIYDVKIYNGLKDVPPKKYSNQINNNTANSFKKEMLWENEPYKYNVIRWMYHLDPDGKPYTPKGITPDAKDHGIAVPGQYQRIFTQQANADIAWSPEKPMKEQYAQAREAAKDRKNNKKLYDKAVFATDRELQKYAYPIKSGYYFNPAGSYTFTVKTVMYKQSDEDTQDHQDLVDTLIDSFRYESNLIFINNDKQAVNLTNDKLQAQGGGFKAVPGILSVQNPKGVNGTVMLDVLDRKDKTEQRYWKKVEPIPYSMQKTGETHEYWKMVLEGYQESGTLGSNTNYQYREYVKDGEKKMYRITETTKVTIRINPNNIPVYTHANMQNGNYYIKAWLKDMPLSKGKHTYSKLGTLQGVDVLDKIDVTVIGSMFDDLNS